VKALGNQLLVEMYDCDADILDDEVAIARHMRDAALAAGATIVLETFHRFAPQGVSGVVVIAESHLAIHTWPEHGYAAVDLFTCGESLDQDRCFSLLCERLRCDRFSIVNVARGHMAAVQARQGATAL